MSFTNTAQGRPRDAHREAAILRATLDLIAEVGYDALSIEGVARRAGASKATIYRRWAGKRELVAAAAAAMVPPTAPDVDTGSLRGDLLALCTRLRDTLAQTHATAVLGLLRGGLDDLDLGDRIEQAVGQTGARLPTEVLTRAIDRGELPPTADPFAYEEVAAAALVLRRLNDRVTDDAYLARLVDRVLVPALGHRRPGTGSTDDLPGGLFSGRPDAPRDLHDHPDERRTP